MTPATQTRSELTKLARDKLARVLGEASGQRVFDETLRSMSVEDLHTPDDLYAFGERLTSRGGFEAAVGRLLGVAAVMRGAKGPPR